MASAAPKTITEPSMADKGTNLTRAATGGVFLDGTYINTTRKEEGQDYTYMW